MRGNVIYFKLAIPDLLWSILHRGMVRVVFGQGLFLRGQGCKGMGRMGFRHLFAGSSEIRRWVIPFLCQSMIWGLVVASVQGQETGSLGLGPLDGFGQAGGLLPEGESIAVRSYYEVDPASGRGRLHVEANIGDGWHLYSTTQKKGGPTPTKIAVLGPEGVKVQGAFEPDVPPKSSLSTVWENLMVEEHEGKVVWTAGIELPSAMVQSHGPIEVKFDGLTCQTDGSCIPVSERLTASYAGTFQAPVAGEEFRDGNYPVAWKVELSPGTASPGSQVELRITATPEPPYHVYASSITDSKNATNLVLTQLGGLTAAAPQSSTAAVAKTMGPGIGEIRYHEGSVTWTIALQVPPNASEGESLLRGMVGYQACTETSCLQPKGLSFEGSLRIGATLSDVPVPLAMKVLKHRDVLEQAVAHQRIGKFDAGTNEGTQENNEPASAPAVTLDPPKYSLGMILGMALVGGLILNLMPCVLPVIGLKMLALVKGAGDDHRKVFSHNLFYSLGLLSVFWVLAGVAIFVRWKWGSSFGWGQQFSYFEFRFALTLLVFAMALSFLGTWELPIPGFASGTASQKLQQHEGAAGSFFKGVFTTILATPCSGPYLGAVFGFTLGASPMVILLVFTTVGFGMALPFLMIGLVPQLVYWLPRPGAWMETLKQLMGFLLLGTVAFLFSGFGNDQRVPVFVTLIGVWFACWMVGRVPLWDTLNRRLVAWVGGVTSAAAIGFLAFSFLGPAPAVVQWQPYDPARLAQLQAEGRTVMVDFTAEWCLNCKLNYKMALNTEATANQLAALGAVPMIADWTEPSDLVQDALNRLQSNSIPILAIYPAGKPNEPIILRDIVTQQEVLDALQMAGPSKRGAAEDAVRPVSLR